MNRCAIGPPAIIDRVTHGYRASIANGFLGLFDDLDMTLTDGISKIFEWQQFGPNYGDTAADTTLTNFDDMSWENPYDVAKDSDCLILVTEWNEFKHLDMARIKELMANPILIDGRNIWDPNEMAELGFNYFGVGRPHTMVNLNGGDHQASLPVNSPSAV